MLSDGVECQSNFLRVRAHILNDKKDISDSTGWAKNREPALVFVACMKQYERFAKQFTRMLECKPFILTNCLSISCV